MAVIVSEQSLKETTATITTTTTTVVPSETGRVRKTNALLELSQKKYK